MIIENSSDIITEHKQQQFNNGLHYELLLLRDQKAIVITNDAIALYKNTQSIEDPLGNGLLATTSIKDNSLSEAAKPWVKEYKAGFIGLSDDKALLITPIAIQLFHNRKDALNNRNEICKLDLEPIS